MKSIGGEDRDRRTRNGARASSRYRKTNADTNEKMERTQGGILSERKRIAHLKKRLIKNVLKNSLSLSLAAFSVLRP